MVAVDDVRGAEHNMCVSARLGLLRGDVDSKSRRS